MVDSNSSLPLLTSDSISSHHNALPILSKPLPNPPGRARLLYTFTHPKKWLVHLPWLPEFPKWLRMNGWRPTVLFGLCLAIPALIVNVVVVVWGSRQPVDPATGNPMLYEGPCSQSQTISTWSSIGINVISALLLACSNATIQCMSAPTRKMVDKMHGQGKWLNIGTSSFTNWKSMSWRRLCLCSVLAITSIPLSLLYNSALYSTTSANEYYVMTASEGILSYPASNLSADLQYYTNPSQKDVATTIQQLAISGRLLNISFTDCMDIYAPTFIGRYSNVLLITSSNYPYSADPNSLDPYYYNSSGSNYYNISNLNYGNSLDPDYSPCSVAYDSSTDCVDKPTNTGPFKGISAGSFLQRQVPGMALQDEPYDGCATGVSVIDIALCHLSMTDTKLTDFKYCLVQEAQEICTIEMSTSILMTVAICNALKIICYFLALLQRSFAPLVTLGDAIASFSQRPDETTYLLGPISASEVPMQFTTARCSTCHPIWKVEMLHYVHSTGAPECGSRETRNTAVSKLSSRRLVKKLFWFAGASPRQWWLTYLMCLLLWLLFAGILTGSQVSLRLSGLNGSTIELQNMSSGFGSATENNINSALIQITQGLPLFANILIANSAQVLVSFGYVFYNALITSLVMSREFTAYARKRSGLRVTSPQGRQRSTFWLSLPYKFAFPLLAASTLLHWLISQAIYLVEVRLITPKGDPDPVYYMNVVGWSLEATVSALIVGVAIILYPITLGFQKYPTGAPLVRNNSLAISAACHPLPGKENEAEELLKYGYLGEDENGNKLYGFSSGRVKPLSEAYTTEDTSSCEV